MHKAYFRVPTRRTFDEAFWGRGTLYRPSTAKSQVDVEGCLLCSLHQCNHKGRPYEYKTDADVFYSSTEAVLGVCPELVEGSATGRGRETQ